MTDLAFWVAVYVSLTVGAMAGMCIVAALHDCRRDTGCRRRRPEPMRYVRVLPRIYDWDRPEIGEPIGSDPGQSLKRRWDG